MDKKAGLLVGGSALALGLIYYLTRPPAPEVAQGRIDDVEYTLEGEMAELAVSPAVKAQIEEVLNKAYAEPHQLPIPFGGRVRCAITWTNIGAAGARDVLSLYGTYDEATNTFTLYFGSVVKGVSLAAGASKTTNVDTVCDRPEMVGTWDGAAIVGFYDEATGEITVDDIHITRAAISVAAPAAPTGQITDVTYSAV